MTRSHSIRVRFELCFAATAVLAAHDAAASVLEKSMRLGNVDVQYRLVSLAERRPTPAKAYPADPRDGRGSADDGPAWTVRSSATFERTRSSSATSSWRPPRRTASATSGAAIFPEFLRGRASQTTQHRRAQVSRGGSIRTGGSPRSMWQRPIQTTSCRDGIPGQHVAADRRE